MISKKESNFIKLAGITAMLIDHIGAFLYPLELLRIIGRIAFPLFAYQLGIGYSKTSNKEKYFRRLFSFALISQIPFFLLQRSFSLNILFSLLLGIMAIWVLEQRKWIYLVFLIPLSCLAKQNNPA